MHEFTITCTPNVLHQQIVQHIRAAAAKIADFEEGAIAVRFLAKTPEAAAWLGDPRACVDDTDVDVDFIHSIAPGKPKTRRPGWRGDPQNREVSCAGYVMLKLEGCARAVIGGHGYCSDDLPPQLKAEGRVNSRGAMCFDVMPFDRSTGELLSDDPWLRIYVGVSGASGIEDKWCAYHAWDAIVEATGASAAGHIRHPANYDPHISEMKGFIQFKPEFAPSAASKSHHYDSSQT